MTWWPTVLLFVAVASPTMGGTHTHGPLEVPSDAGSGHDADDACIAGAAPSITLNPGQDTYGLFLHPLEASMDTVDVYGIVVEAAGELAVTMDPAPLLPDRAPAPNYDLILLDEQCQPVATDPAHGSQRETVRAPVQPGAFRAAVVVPGPFGLPIAEATATGAAAYCDPTCLLLGYKILADPPEG